MKQQKKSTQSAKSSNGTSATSSQGQDTEALLKADHRKVEELFRKFEQADRQQVQTQIAKQICNELIIHAMLEEELFYPECRKHGVEDELLDAAQVEHDGVKILINELMTQKPDAPFYKAKVKVLCENIKHHVSEEEKSDGIFAKAREAGVDMGALGQRLHERKQQLKEKADGDRLGPPQVRSLTSISTQKSRFQQEDERMAQGRYGREGYGGRQSRNQDYDDDRGMHWQGSQQRGRYSDQDRDMQGYGSSQYGQGGYGSSQYGQGGYGSSQYDQGGFGSRGRYSQGGYGRSGYGQRDHDQDFGQDYQSGGYRQQQSGQRDYDQGGYGQSRYGRGGSFGDDDQFGQSEYRQGYGQGRRNMQQGEGRHGQSSYDQDEFGQGRYGQGGRQGHGGYGYDDMRSSRSRGQFEDDDNDDTMSGGSYGGRNRSGSQRGSRGSMF